MKVITRMSSVLLCAVASAAFAMEDDCGAPLSPELQADHWIACEGIGRDKDSAIDNALKRGVSMVYGQVMSAEDKTQSQYAEVGVESPEGDVSASAYSESIESKMAKKTAGFVREYKVIWTKPEGDDLKAHVHARILNPRSGVDAVILIAPPEATVELKSELVKVGPKNTVSGREIGKVAESALCGALNGSKHFKVRTVGDLKKSAASAALDAAMVDAGLVPTSELLQAGQLLTCDYILSTRIEKIAYSKKLGQDKKSRKFGQMQSLKVVLSFKLTNVRTGTSAGEDTVTLSLSDSEIKDLLEADEDADLLRCVFNALVQPLRGWIKKNTR